MKLISKLLEPPILGLVHSLLLCYFSGRYSHVLPSNFPTKTAHPSHSSHPTLLNDLHNYLLLKMNNFVCDKWCVYSIRPIKIGQHACYYYLLKGFIFLVSDFTHIEWINLARFEITKICTRKVWGLIFLMQCIIYNRKNVITSSCIEIYKLKYSESGN